ncbi:MAG: hypothetical protein ACJAZV_000108, partial [Roseivirga sp.]
APYFTKDSQIKFMFIDGDKYDFEIKEKKEGGKGEATAPSADIAAVVGSWTYAFESPQGETTGKMVIKNDGGTLTGVMSSGDGSPDADMQDVTFVNGVLTFAISRDGGGQSIELVVSGSVTGKNYNAEVTVSAYNFSTPLTATKDDGQ